ncbi:geranylgeranyl transferase type-1 subunit beta, partial [Coemansia linderi]
MLAAAIVHSGDAIKHSETAYESYFSWENSSSSSQTTIDLHLPAAGASETFSLLMPKSYDRDAEPRDDYLPVNDLLSTIHAIATYLVDSAEFKRQVCEDKENGIMRRLERSRNRRNGDDFVRAVSEFNALLDAEREAGRAGPCFDENLIPSELAIHVIEQIYNRIVAPTVGSLRQYKAFSNNVYGEILPTLVNEFIDRTNITHTSTFVDLGCGIGNVVLQVAAQTGCNASGIEIMKVPARFAKRQACEFEHRMRLYKLRHGHARYFRICLNGLPRQMTSLDAARMTFVQLCLVGLAALGKLDEVCSAEDKRQMIEWIYAQQVLGDGTELNAAYCGFRGGSLFGPHDLCDYVPANSANVAGTYSALCALLLLGDDLSRVDKPAIVEALRCLQQDSGCFAPHPGTTERDPRFIYCACAISAILDDWSGVNKDAAVEYIVSCCNPDGGMTQAPFQESHGGHLYCCVSSLALMGRLDAIPDRQRTLKWALQRQNGGYQGRVNKPADSCYSFWVGAAVELLGGHDLVDAAQVSAFLVQCETRFGGIAKFPDEFPDPLHAALGIVGFTFCNPDGFPRMSPTLLLPESLAHRLGIKAAKTTSG